MSRVLRLAEASVVECHKIVAQHTPPSGRLNDYASLCENARRRCHKDMRSAADHYGANLSAVTAAFFSGGMTPTDYESRATSLRHEFERRQANTAAEYITSVRIYAASALNTTVSEPLPTGV